MKFSFKQSPQKLLHLFDRLLLIIASTRSEIGFQVCCDRIELKIANYFAFPLFIEINQAGAHFSQFQTHGLRAPRVDDKTYRSYL